MGSGRFAFVTAALLAAASEPALSCPVGAAAAGTVHAGVVAALSPAGEIILSDGTMLRLPQLDRDPSGSADTDGLIATGLAAGQALRYVPVQTEPDRWGRIIAHVIVADPQAGDTWLEQALVARGLMRVRVEEAGRACARALLVAEHDARRQRKGLWARISVAEAEDVEALAGQAGSYAIVTGRIASVGVRRERTFLNFGRRWSEDFTVSMPATLWRQLAASGVDATSLTGKTIRVRGTIEMAGGPTIRVALPEQIEID